MFLTILAGLIAFAVAALAMPHFIRLYQLKKLGAADA